MQLYISVRREKEMTMYTSQALFLQIILALCATEMVHAQDACSESEKSVNLAGGQRYHGIVEVCLDGVWRTVCSDNFGFETAQLVCGELSLSTQNPSGMYKTECPSHTKLLL